VIAIQNRYDFVYLFDIVNGNPNGDPDSGNVPRQDLDTQRGLVTDVALKRKIRNYVETVKGGAPPFAIYMQQKAILNQKHQLAYEALGLKSESTRLPKEELKARELTKWMCENFYDIRTFGAVMTTDINAGQVRGPVQLGFSQSLDPIAIEEVTIIRGSITNERDASKERTMGRKYIIPYGLYRCHGFVSSFLAGDEKKGTGFSQIDLDLLFESLANMFELDRAAARAEMNAQKLIVFKHHSALGAAPAHKLFTRVQCALNIGIKYPRHFSDYKVTVDYSGLPSGVEIVEYL
jgi:CRISPR-associated protein Csd2